jgi:hypothetical protein
MRPMSSDTASLIHLRILNSSIDAKIAVLNVERNFSSQYSTDAKIAVLIRFGRLNSCIQTRTASLQRS